MMMNQFHYRAAGEADDAELRRLMSENPLRGAMALSFLREPSLFQSLRHQGHPFQVIVAVHRASGDIAAMVVLSTWKVFVNGACSAVSYISGLRFLPSFSRAAILAGVARYLREIHDGISSSLYLFAVMDEERDFARILMKKKKAFPFFKDMGDYVTIVISLKAVRKQLVPQDYEQPFRVDDTREVLDFLNEEGPRKQFFPVPPPDMDWAAPGNKGCFVYEQGKIAGAALLRVQSSWRQIVVARYSPVLGLLRPFHNIAAIMQSKPQLPPPGKPLSALYLTSFAVRNNDPRIFRELLLNIRKEHRGSSHDYLLLGLHSRDPLLGALASFNPLKLKSTVMVGHFEDGEDGYRQLDRAMIPYIELADL